MKNLATSQHLKVQFSVALCFLEPARIIMIECDQFCEKFKCVYDEITEGVRVMKILTCPLFHPINFGARRVLRVTLISQSEAGKG